MRTPTVLGVHPAVRGFAWVLFVEPDRPVDWGGPTFRRPGGRTMLEELDAVAGRFRPDIIAAETWQGRPHGKGHRARQFLSGAPFLAECYGAKFATYTAHEIADALGIPRGSTRHASAVATSERLPALAHRLPPPRRAWDRPDPRLALFAAAAAAIAAYDQDVSETAAST